MITSKTDLSPEARRQLHVFRSSLPIRVKLQEILRSLGSTKGITCLDIGSDNAMLNYYIRKGGGDWHSVVASKDIAESVREMVKDNVKVQKGSKLPYDDKSFDVVAIINELERSESDVELIEECHRILKPDGKLVISTARIKSWSLIPLLQGAMGVSPMKRGMVRPGYTEYQLFNILKDGFDVFNIRTYSRFCVELTDVLVQFIVRLIKLKHGEDSRKVTRFYSVARLFYGLASQFDMLLFFTKGHNMTAAAKRRLWKSREAPILTDGRSITEVVLSKAAK
ncbi:class I SAM-dependent methyltransferase [Verrucomicrobiota bacterium]